MKRTVENLAKVVSSVYQTKMAVCRGYQDYGNIKMFTRYSAECSAWNDLRRVLTDKGFFDEQKPFTSCKQNIEGIYLIVYQWVEWEEKMKISKDEKIRYRASIKCDVFTDFLSMIKSDDMLEWYAEYIIIA